VYVTHNGALSREQELWVCVLAAPTGSVLGGLTAAELDGLANFGVREVHVVVPGGFRKPQRAAMVVHYSNSLDAQDVHPVKLPPRTRIARSLVDAAVWSTHERWSRAIVLAGVQQRLTRPDDLRPALDRRGPCKNHALITEAIGDAEGGIASVPEHDFDMILRTSRLPAPSRQVIVMRSDGRYYLDAEWREYRVSVEVHGTQHLAIVTWDADLDRTSELAADGRTVLQFSSHSVRYRKTHVSGLVERALRANGWQPS
jgi:very-short-patch-repair endonuclease